MEFKKFKLYFNIGVGFFCLAILALLLSLVVIGRNSFSDVLFPVTVAALFGPYFIFVNTRKLKKCTAAQQENSAETK